MNFVFRGMWRRAMWYKFIGVSDKRTTSIFRMNEWKRIQYVSPKLRQICKRLHGFEVRHPRCVEPKLQPFPTNAPLLGTVGHRTHCTKYTPESIAWFASPRTLLLIKVISILLQSNFIYFTIRIVPASLKISLLIEVISVPLYSTLFKLQ
jgi:hypothetical protein